MGRRLRLSRCGMLCAFVSLAPAAQADDQGTMQVGEATISLGAGPAMLTLPDIAFFFHIDNASPTVVGTSKTSTNFDHEIGLGFSGAIDVPVAGWWGMPASLSLHGFYADIGDSDTRDCITTATSSQCALTNLTDSLIFVETLDGGIRSDTDRDVAHWGVGLEKTMLLPAARNGDARHFAVGVDVRGIDQDIRTAGVAIDAAREPSPSDMDMDLHESLDARYYGLTAAWGGDYRLPFLAGLTSGLGLRTSFLLRGGIYYADADYDGDLSVTGDFNFESEFSLSDHGVAFIGGLQLKTTKVLGPRTRLDLVSDYEWYSWVPDMRYDELSPIPVAKLDHDDAFSARTTLRLTIGLGPEQVYSAQ